MKTAAVKSSRSTAGGAALINNPVTTPIREDLQDNKAERLWGRW